MANQPTQTNTIRVPAASDQAVAEMMDEIAGLAEGTSVLVTIGGLAMGQRERAGDFLESSGLGSDHDWNTSRLINQIDVVGLPSIRAVKFWRGVTHFESAARGEPSAWENEISFFWRDETPPPSTTIQAIAGIVDRHRKAFGTVAGDETALPLRDVFARQVADLTSLQTKIVRNAEQARLKREEELDKRREQLEQAAIERAAKLDEEHEARLAAVRAQQADWETRKRDLDDRTHMHARRALREHITDDLKGRLTRPPVSRSTALFRLSIFAGGLCFIALLVFFAVQSGWELANLLDAQARQSSPEIVSLPGQVVPSDPILAYVLIGRLSLAAAAAAALGFYLLNWARQLHDTDLRSERDLERYRYDLDRATWAIETILEAQKGGSVPDEWISGVTNGLFARGERRDDEQSQAEALGALLNFAAEAELGPGGTRIKLTKSGISRLRRSGLVEDAE